MKCVTYKVCSKYRKLRIETTCLTTETWRLVLNDFCSRSLTFDLYRLTFTFYNRTARQAHHRSLQTSNVNSNVKRYGPSEGFPISDNVSVVIQGVLVQQFRFL